jgi:hypothetical protein
MGVLRDVVYIEGEGFMHWPMCKTPGCKNSMNMKASNGYCWPCQPSGKSFDEVVGELCSALQEGV